MFQLSKFVKLAKLGIMSLLCFTSLSMSAFASEDCLSFRPEATTVQHVGGAWKVVSANEWMFSFGARQDLANRALQVIQAYRMADSCFVGRPNPLMSYLLTAHHAAPSGNRLSGEDCIAFNPASVEAKYIPSARSWKMVQGNMWMLDFGNRKDEALDAVQVVKTYGFNRQCFVGRPNPPFTYWKKD